MTSLRVSRLFVILVSFCISVGDPANSRQLGERVKLIDNAGRVGILLSRQRFGSRSDCVRRIVGLDASALIALILSARTFIRSTLKRYIILTRIQASRSMIWAEKRGRCQKSDKAVSRGLKPNSSRFGTEV